MELALDCQTGILGELCGIVPRKAVDAGPSAEDLTRWEIPVELQALAFGLTQP